MAMQMARVLFDDEIFSIQFRGGISRYFTQLFEGLMTVPDVTPILPFPLTCNVHLAASACFSGRMFGGNGAIPGGRTLTRAINRRATASALARGGYDIVHATFFDATLANRVRDARLVITVHDMATELMPEAVKGLTSSFSHAKRTLIEKAAAVVAVSANTAADVTRLTGRSMDDIRIIYHGVSERLRWRQQLGPGPSLPERYILFVGERRGYKNFIGVAPALAKVLHNETDVSLVCFGGGPLAAEERAPFQSAGVAQRVIGSGGTDQDLAWAYAHAAAFVFPSLYEGFGMPILEAMINRCPVVLSHCSCFPEIAADAALYFDPAQPDGLVEVLSRVLRDVQVQRRLGEAGARRAADFSWQRCVFEHAALYRRLAS